MSPSCFVRSKDKRWISRILRALYRSGSHEACGTVSHYAGHPYEYVRMRAFLFLGEHGCDKYKELLWEGLNDPYFMVRDAARGSLVKLGFNRAEVEEHLKDVRRIELLNLLSEKCPDGDILFSVKLTNPFERYWYGRITCKQ